MASLDEWNRQSIERAIEEQVVHVNLNVILNALSGDCSGCSDRRLQSPAAGHRSTGE